MPNTRFINSSIIIPVTQADAFVPSLSSNHSQTSPPPSPLFHIDFPRASIRSAARSYSHSPPHACWINDGFNHTSSSNNTLKLIVLPSDGPLLRANREALIASIIITSFARVCSSCKNAAVHDRYLLGANLSCLSILIKRTKLRKFN